MQQTKFDHLNGLINQALAVIDSFKSNIYYDSELANVYHKANLIEKKIIQLREDLELHK